MLVRTLSEPLAPAEGPSRPGGPCGAGRHGKLLHGYLHKTSNTLCGIKGYASLIADDTPPDGATGRWVRKIIAEVEQLEAIYRSVQDMAFAEPDRDGGADLDLTVQRAVARAVQRHPELEVERGPCRPGALLLPARDLELALVEILTNSAETGAADRPVRVTIRTVARGPESLALLLRDDGPGLRPGLLDEAAAPFVTTKAGHLGIGLARVDTLMDMYGLGWSLRSLPGLGTAVELAVATPYRAGGEPAAEGTR
jgi:two-component system sensor histidine kinase PilS (NtrC family)